MATRTLRAAMANKMFKAALLIVTTVVMVALTIKVQPYAFATIVGGIAAAVAAGHEQAWRLLQRLNGRLGLVCLSPK